MLVAHPGAELYGSDRVVLESVTAMTGAGAVVVVTVPESGPLVERLERAGATVVLAPALVLRKRMLRPRNWPSAMAATLRAVGASRRLLRPPPALVYVNTITLPLWPVLARMRGIPVVTHIHEAEAEASRIMLMALFGPHLLATTTVTNSEFSRSIVARASAPLARRTHVIYNGVAGPVSATRTRVSLEGRPVRLTYLGRLSPRKGTDLVIAAAAELVDDGVDVEVDLIGEAFDGYDWFVDALHRAVADRGLGSRVRFLGFRDDVWTELRLADIVVIPSRVGRAVRQHRRRGGTGGTSAHRRRVERPARGDAGPARRAPRRTGRRVGDRRRRARHHRALAASSVLRRRHRPGWPHSGSTPAVPGRDRGPDRVPGAATGAHDRQRRVRGNDGPCLTSSQQACTRGGLDVPARQASRCGRRSRRSRRSIVRSLDEVAAHDGQRRGGGYAATVASAAAGTWNHGPHGS